MQIIDGRIERGDTTRTAMGGTELMALRLLQVMDKDLLSNFQIVVSRIEHELRNDKIRILFLQDLPGDPASEHLKNGGWSKFHKIVYNSNWQMQAYSSYYKIPYSHGIVLHNAIDPVPEHEKPKDVIRLGYWSTPHRGLNILVPVFKKLCEKYDNIELNVFSSFNIYGWGERDEQFKDLFDECKEHPKINYFGSVPNDELRTHLETMHIFAYPNTWLETSCICLMEAMSAKMLCVHPNYGCLFETGANWTQMYQMQDDINQHAQAFYQVMDISIASFWDEGIQSRLGSQAAYANIFYNWALREHQWNALLKSLLNVPRALPTSEGYFEFSTGH